MIASNVCARFMALVSQRQLKKSHCITERAVRIGVQTRESLYPWGQNIIHLVDLSLPHTRVCVALSFTVHKT
jgi:hypothetical protein